MKYIFKHKELLLALLLPVFFFFQYLIHPIQFINKIGDIWIYSAWKFFLVESVKNYGSLPLWNPYLFGGTPFVGDPQVAIFYPLNLLFFLFPIENIFIYIVVFDFFIMSLFTYLFLRLIGQSPLSSLIGSAIFTFSGTLTVRTIPAHLMIFDGIVWFPILMYLGEKYVQENKIRYILLSGIALGCSLLSGNAQIPFYTMSAVSLYLCCRILIPFSFLKLKKVIITLTIITLVGTAVSAIQLLPTLEFARYSIRNHGSSFEFASSYSFHPFQITTLILPHLFGSAEKYNFWGKGNFWEDCAYLGTIPLLLASVGFFARKKKQYYSIFLILGFLSFLFALGKYTPFYTFLYNYVPGISLFRAPSRILYIYTFSIAVLASIGYQALETKTLKRESTILKWITLICFDITVCFGILLIFIYTNYPSFTEFFINNFLKKYSTPSLYALNISYATKSIVFITFFLFSVSFLFFLLLKKIIKRQLFLVILFILIVFDLYNFIRISRVTGFTSLSPTSSEITFVEKDKSLYRIFDYDGILFQESVKRNVQTLTGYNANYLNYYRDFLWLVGDHANTPFESFFVFYNIKNPTILKLLNTKYVIAKRSGNINALGLKKIEKNIYEVSQTFPRAFITHEVISMNHAATLKAIQNSTYDLRNTSIVAEAVNLKPQKLHRSEDVNITSYTPNKIVVGTHLTSPGMLVLSEVWYPGWKAIDNGKEIPILKTDYVLRGVLLTKGKHTVTFTYDPLSYKIGYLITGSSLIILVLISCIYCIKHEQKINH